MLNVFIFFHGVEGRLDVEDRLDVDSGHHKDDCSYDYYDENDCMKSLIFNLLKLVV